MTRTFFVLLSAGCAPVTQILMRTRMVIGIKGIIMMMVMMLVMVMVMVMMTMTMLMLMRMMMKVVMM